MSDVVVLLGAGASFGCGDVVPENPPLGKDLFAKLEERGGAAAAVPEDLKQVFRDDFEKGMAAYIERTNGNVMTFQRELARYVAQFAPGISNVYCDLVRTLRRYNVVYASLNYDLLLELAAQEVGQPCTYSLEGPPQIVKVLKPHGSCNFWPHMPGVQIKGNFYNTSGAVVEAPVRPLDLQETLLRCERERALSPALAFYAEGKAVKICPRFVDEQLEQWKRAVSGSKIVFVVGVRVHPPDRHIWDILGAAESQLIYFGLPPDEQAFNTWRRAANRENATFCEAPFKQAVYRMQQVLAAR